MDWQSFINAGGAIALSIVGWFARMLWEADRELRSDLSRLREELPQTYVTKDDYRLDVRELKEMMQRMLDKLDTKMDKHGQ